ncbi:stage V sporulation protein AD [Ruminococcus sp.]|uniref:stage V sporulation protein AD n=1 Tax=Ruminococcus sp. TaxID=41978 RepID=UPI0026226D7B|nr:stage V sporulation protein AD [Ruminococcus sp.]MDD7556930.1 stage V sporulation protein AD [Ruminococcus sp.]MDY4963530.1 stage V sporulation protein AD [Ruminococcus callidus]
MAKKIGTGTYLLEHTPSAAAYAAIVGQMEGGGPLGACFDYVEQDSHFGKDSWEQAESELQRRTVEAALKKGGLTPKDADLILAGDLINQCTGTTYGLRGLGIPLLGLYGACSTMAEGLALGGILMDGGIARHIVAATSSHFSTAERQFRFPLSYGGQRTPTAQWTCTASGAVVLAPCGDPPYLRAVTVGRIVDYGITDANNMGAAMAPAAADTILRFLGDTGAAPGDFDAIVTGDLGIVGSRLLCTLMEKEGVDITRQHRDCGAMIFDPEQQDTHAGGSGCGCSASVLCGHFLPRLRTGEIRNILFAATGALMSPTSSQQGESIPGISHLIHLSAEKKGGK